MTGCADTTTDLSTEEALVIIEPYFLVVREKFLAAGVDAIARVRLRCRSWVHDTPRHFGACNEDGSEIVVAPELAELGYETVCALLAHECGHAADFLYPAEFHYDDDSVTRRERAGYTDKQWRTLLRAWKNRHADLVELTADRIAEQVLGTPIGYRGPCMLQSFDGIPRPLGLR